MGTKNRGSYRMLKNPKMLKRLMLIGLIIEILCLLSSVGVFITAAIMKCLTPIIIINLIICVSCFALFLPNYILTCSK